MRVLETLTPKPFRGDTIAAGVAVLVIAAGLFELRAIGELSPWLRFGPLALGWAFVATLGWRAPLERPEPRAYQTVLHVSALLLALLALAALAQALGAHGWLAGYGTLCWVFAVLFVHAAVLGRARASPTCTLLAAVMLAGSLAAGAAWGALRPRDPGSGTVDWHMHQAFLPSQVDLRALRWLLLALAIGYVLNAVRLRDRARRHGVAFVNAAGLVLIGIAMTWTRSVLPWPADGPASSAEAGFGWTLLLLAGGFALVGYGGVDRERGPVWIGALLLLHFAVLEQHGSLLGWPLVLLLAAAALLLVGLHRTIPAPPAPDLDAPLARRVDLSRFRRPERGPRGQGPEPGPGSAGPPGPTT